MKIVSIPKIIGKTDIFPSEKKRITRTMAEITAEITAILIAVCLGEIRFIASKFGKAARNYILFRAAFCSCYLSLFNCC